MARIAGVNIPTNKRVEIALTYIFGIGLTRSQQIMTKAGIGAEMRVKDLTEGEVDKIRSVIDTDFDVEGDLRRVGGRRDPDARSRWKGLDPGICRSRDPEARLVHGSTAKTPCE